jgi:hypothetical protein
MLGGEKKKWQARQVDGRKEGPSSGFWRYLGYRKKKGGSHRKKQNLKMATGESEGEEEGPFRRKQGFVLS